LIVMSWGRTFPSGGFPPRREAKERSGRGWRWMTSGPDYPHTLKPAWPGEDWVSRRNCYREGNRKDMVRKYAQKYLTHPVPKSGDSSFPKEKTVERRKQQGGSMKSQISKKTQALEGGELLTPSISVWRQERSRKKPGGLLFQPYPGVEKH